MSDKDKVLEEDGTAPDVVLTDLGDDLVVDTDEAPGEAQDEGGEPPPGYETLTSIVGAHLAIRNLRERFIVPLLDSVDKMAGIMRDMVLQGNQDRAELLEQRRLIADLERRLGKAEEFIESNRAAIAHANLNTPFR